MGAGIFGLSVAFACQRRGARVRVIDPGGPGAGSSGGLLGALAPHVPENWNPKKAFQLESLLAAPAYWSAVEEAGGYPSGYRRAGRLQALADDRAVALARTREASAAALWPPDVSWHVVAAEEAGDRAPQSASGFLVHDTLSAQIPPRQAVAALAAAVKALGGVIEAEGDAEGQVVWATGWRGLEALSETLGRSVGNGVKGQAALLDCATGQDVPQLFTDGLHIVTHEGGVAVGSTSEREFADPDATDAALDDLIGRARTLVPQLADAPVIARWAGVRPRARSRAPMLGPWPDRPGHFIANGGFKIGFGMAPKVGEVMADLVLDARDAIPAGFRVADSL